MRTLMADEISANFGDGILSVHAAVADDGAHAVAAILRKAECGTHPPTIGQIPGCGSIFNRAANPEAFARAATASHDDCAHFAIAIEKSAQGYFSIRNGVEIDQCDYVWVPDGDAKDIVRRVVMDQLCDKFDVREDISVDFDCDNRAFTYSINGVKCSEPYATHNQAYVAASMSLLSSKGVRLDAAGQGGAIKDLVNSTLTSYATEVINEYNEWLAGEAYEVSQAEFDASDTGAEAKRINTPQVIVGRANADHLMATSLKEISERLADIEQNMDAPAVSHPCC